MPVEGTSSPATAEISGSIAPASFASSIRQSLTPQAVALRAMAWSLGNSSDVEATTILPQRLKGMPASAANAESFALPSTHSRALSEPGG